MDRICLSHIAGYLPHGLPARLSYEGRFNLDSEYPNEHQHKTGIIEDFHYSDGEFGGVLRITSNYSFDFDELSEVEIILRPMSDLTNEMAVISGYKDASALKLMIISQMIPYTAMKNLFRHHYDVFGLIDRGLAIDINTVEGGVYGKG